MFILYRDYSVEGRDVIGVFSSEEKAISHIERVIGDRQFSLDWYSFVIQEWKVDSILESPLSHTTY